MENAGFAPGEAIEMESSKIEVSKLSLQSNNKDAERRFYCDTSQCCKTNDVKPESSWHNMKTKFLLIFLIGFFIWAISYFCLLHNDLIWKFHSSWYELGKLLTNKKNQPRMAWICEGEIIKNVYVTEHFFVKVIIIRKIWMSCFLFLEFVRFILSLAVIEKNQTLKFYF